MTGHPEGAPDSAHPHHPPVPQAHPVHEHDHLPRQRTAVDVFEHGLESIIFWSRWLQAPIYIGLIVAGFLYLYRFGGELAELADHVVYGIPIEEMREREHAHAAENKAQAKAEGKAVPKAEEAAHEAPKAEEAKPAETKAEGHGDAKPAEGHAAADAHASGGHGHGPHAEADPVGRRYKRSDGKPGNYIMEEGEFLFRVLTLVDITMVMNLLVMVIIGGYAIFVSKLSVGDHEDHPDWLDHINANTLKIKLSSSLVGITGIHLLKSFIDIDKLLAEPAGNYTMAWEVAVHFTFLLSVLALSLSERMLGHHDPDGQQH